MEADPEIALPRGELAQWWARAASRTAAVALVFCCVVLALLVFNAQVIKNSNPFNHVELTAMISQLQTADQAGQADEAARLMKEIKELDASIRSQFFRAHAINRQGWMLLLGGLAVFLFSTKAAATLQRQAPRPAPAAGPRPVTFSVSPRNAVIAVIVVTALVLLIASYATPGRKVGPVPAEQAGE